MEVSRHRRQRTGRGTPVGFRRFFKTTTCCRAANPGEPDDRHPAWRAGTDRRRCNRALDSRDGGYITNQLDWLPALSVSYGLSSERLPIGIQLVRKWLDEATLLRLGVMLERKGGLGDRRPTI